MNPHKHGWTQGPWTKVRGELVGANGKKVVEYGSGVAIMCGAGPEREYVANAAIRNAAPELYEALETVVIALDVSRRAFGAEPSDFPDFEAWEIKARAALSKAKAPAEGE